MAVLTQTEDSRASLTAVERRTLAAVCQALLPALTAGPGDDPALFKLDAAVLRVPAALEQKLSALDPELRIQFRRLLGLLNHPLLGVALVRRWRSFTAMTAPDQERLLQALATSRFGPLRGGFQVLKRFATFLFYSVLDEDGHNPTWPAIGYQASTNPPALVAPLVLTAIRGPTTLEGDVCVIGSGAGGGVMAAELAAAGKRVIVLEVGGGRQAPDFDQREKTGVRNLYLDQGAAATTDLGLTLLAGATLGGGTAVNWQTCLQTPESIRDEWVEASGCQHFAEKSFTRSLQIVADRIHAGVGESVVNRNNALLRDGCAALGHEWTVLQRNANGCDSTQCGYCVFGCRVGGKQSTAVTFLHDAQVNGDTVIIPNCRAERVQIADGRVTGVTACATDPPTGARFPVEIRAPRVVVAAGSLHSPALLLRSGLALPALGRHLYLHPTTAVSGYYDEPVAAWNGPPQSIVSGQFAHLSGTYGFRLETAPVHPGLMALASPWVSARAHRRLMQQTAHVSSFIVLTRDRNGGRVRINRAGQPRIAYQPGAQEQAHLRQGIAAAVRIHLAAGAREVVTLHAHGPSLRRTPGLSASAIDSFCEEVSRARVARNWCGLFSAHQMGTCRMGRDRRTAVCDATGAVFGVRGLYIGDGSAFPASSGVNPMLTILALAHHTAQAIKQR